MKFLAFFQTCGNHEIKCRVILTLEVFRRRPTAWTERKDTRSGPVPREGGGEGYSTNIWVEVNAEGLKPWPCLGQKPQFCYPVKDKGNVHRLGQTCAKLYTLFRIKRTKIVPCLAAHPRIGHIRLYPRPGCGRNTITVLPKQVNTTYRYNIYSCTSLSESCSLRDASRPSSFSWALFTRPSSSSVSSPLRCRWPWRISICLSLSRIVASRWDIVLDEPACSALSDARLVFMVEIDESFSSRSLSRDSH